MELLKLTIDNCEWFGENFAYNLGFIPEDKLEWKPSPTAKSALEVTTEVLASFGYVRSFFENPEVEEESPSPRTLDEAKAMILSATKEYANFLRGLKAEDLEGEFTTEFGPFAKIRMALMPVQELTHHHGQITYLQTIWGDKDSHFFEFGT